MCNDALFLRHLIAAFGVQPVRVPDLPERYRLFTQTRVALIDTGATVEDWDKLFGTVLAAMPGITFDP